MWRLDSTLLCTSSHRRKLPAAPRAARPALLAALLCRRWLAIIGPRAASPAPRPRSAARPQSPTAQLRRDPDRRPDPGRALRRLHAYPGAPETRAMPNTLDLIAKRGDHLQPLLRPLPALLPLARQPADRPLRPQPQRPRQRPAQRRLHRLHRSGRATTTTSPPGCRRPATARSTSASSSTATATRRTTTARRAARLERLAHGPQRRHRTTTTTATR